MKTFFAIAIYIIAIVCIVVFAGVIVTTLIFWPPCTQMGHNCVVDGWSIAGLAATVLAVAATVLAVLGAVAVAAWWISLNDRVTDQVTKLYNEQKTEINKQVDQIVKDQQQKVDAELVLIQKAFGQLDQRISQASADIDSLHQLSRAVEEIAVDGLMVMGASSLEGWAKRATANNRFPRVPMRMAESYLNSVELDLTMAEDTLSEWETELGEYQPLFQKLRSVQPLGSVQLSEADIDDLLSAQGTLLRVLNTRSFGGATILPRAWNGALRWIAVAQQNHVLGEPQDKELLEELTKKIETYRPRIELLQHRYQRLKDQARLLLAEVREALRPRPQRIIE